MVVWPGGNHLKLWNEWIANPEGKAREKLDAALESLLVDEDIKKSKICTDFLELMLRISPSDPGAETVFDLVDPLATYFNKLGA